MASTVAKVVDDAVSSSTHIADRKLDWSVFADEFFMTIPFDTD